MPKCNCSDSRCSCVIVAGAGAKVTGSGRGDKPYVIEVESGGGTGGASGWSPGDLKWTARASAEAGWLIADGSPVSRTAYAALFAAIGTLHGPGDGATTFNLPNYRDRFALGASADHPLGTTGGAATGTLSASQLPAHRHAIDHNHPAKDTSQAGGHDHELQRSDGVGDVGTTVPRGKSAVVATNRGAVLNDGGHVHAFNVEPYVGNSGSTGSGSPFSLMPPWLAALPLIKT